MVSECEWVSMVYWLHQAGSRKWFVIDHLHRVSDWVSEKTNTQWAHPSSEDIQIAGKVCKISSMSWEIVTKLLLFSMNSRTVLVATKAIYICSQRKCTEYSSILW